MAKLSYSKMATKDKKEQAETLESNGVRTFREKTQIAMARIKTLDAFRETDTMVDLVFTLGRRLFSEPLDKMNVGNLLTMGGKLTGAYAYLGQMSARARAERDVYRQKLDEVEKELMLDHLRDGKYKVTQARAHIAKEVTEIQELVNLKEAEKNQWENVTEATSTMIMFIQSAIKVKENEKFSASRMHNQG